MSAPTDPLRLCVARDQLPACRRAGCGTGWISIRSCSYGYSAAMRCSQRLPGGSDVTAASHGARGSTRGTSAGG